MLCFAFHTKHTRFYFQLHPEYYSAGSVATITCLCMWLQEDYTTDEEALAAHGVKGGAGGILDLLKASKQVAGLDSAALRLDLLDHKSFVSFI